MCVVGRFDCGENEGGLHDFPIRRGLTVIRWRARQRLVSRAKPRSPRQRVDCPPPLYCRDHHAVLDCRVAIRAASHLHLDVPERSGQFTITVPHVAGEALISARRSEFCRPDIGHSPLRL
jgi:hypothetical protein